MVGMGLDVLARFSSTISISYFAYGGQLSDE